MENQDTPPTEPQIAPKWFGAESLETFSKGVAAVLVAIYVVGYLIVSLHDASYGFTELNPLKPKVLSAGILFSVVLLVPAYLARRLYSQSLQITPTQQVSRAAVATLNFYVLCVILTAMAGPLLSTPPTDLLLPPPSGASLSSWVRATVPLIIIVAFSYCLEVARKRYLTHPGLTGTLGAVVVLALLVGTLYASQHHREALITIWMFLSGTLSAMMSSAIANRDSRTRQDVVGLMAAVLVVLGFFSGGVYPQFKASWGGGSAVPVVLYFTRDSRLLPGQQLEAKLLDESEQGFYVVFPNQDRAAFVPRNAVAILSFSEKPLSPEILSGASREPIK